MAKGKTNAMRLLDQSKVSYEIMTYDVADGKIDGLSVAEKTGKSGQTVFKTLVTAGASKQNYVFVIPVDKELDMKKAAKASGEKKIEMIHVKDIQKITGYIRGGCSPIGMKKQYPTIIDASAKDLKSMIVSGGKLGTQIELTLQDLIKMTSAELYEIAQ
ncbi:MULTISPECIES: Cys-tRNA(Pro) deacylase [Cytobacillus]|uniref:Cys-tRNA(Pro) deacylase n=1 Tax=Cytobacillus TaxID=2675230 RepID=UPI00203FBDE3|nr:Cys-tRNA(Pro) deacylase [Cytobacillus kochii]MCM3322366.1 Cys-tRNA(Pro) deacylase [Cytobacillus kochii]MCM3345157.1 Cys-tRNA(Pro) deacylase [Cytobacillus kochii]MDM5209710.1 Cys-tRNA(Pro) deacylase [Cytobacillus kochii]